VSWLRVQIDLGDTDPEPLEHALLELGAVSIEYCDAGNDPILEPDPGTAPLWAKVRVAALFSVDTSETIVRLAIAGSITLPDAPLIYFSIVADKDWISAWQRNLKPAVFGDKLWICPPGTADPAAGSVSVTMEPGLAFGTGAHPTTALCLSWLTTQQLQNKSILDFGCGSGILGIAALALGADHVTAVDIDQQALTATLENARRNQCTQRLRVLEPDLLDPAKTFDLIVANILSGTLVSLEPRLRGHSRSGTRIALSGILTTQITEVSDAYRRWITFDPPVTRQNWAVITGYTV
jgi:ribosomal protein L11 methyltransferase